MVATKPAVPKPTPRPAKPKPPVQAKPPAQAKPQPSDTTASTQTQPAESSAAPSQTAEASAPLRDPYHTAPLDTVPQQVYDGWKQFNLNCARCHGEDAQGTTIAPHLILSLKPDGPINTQELFIQTVCAGRPAKGAYPVEDEWAENLGERPVSDKKIRRVRRDQERAYQGPPHGSNPLPTPCPALGPGYTARPACRR